MAEFKAIVVGAGPVGLVLAHALQVTGIDYVLVEQRSEVPPETAFGIFLWPQIIRIFHQMGLLEALEKISQPMNGSLHQNPKGELLAQEEGYAMLKAVLGYPMLLFDRGSFARTLLQGLENSDRHVKTNKRLTNVINRPDGVTAEFADGTSEEGSIVIGCDGVWSAVRDQMCNQAPEGLFDQSPNPFEAPYTGVFARTPKPEGLEPGRTINVYQPDKQVQVFTSPTEAHIITYQRIPPSKERTYFGQNNAEDSVKPWRDIPVAENVTFGDLWRKKYAGGAANFDEGVLRWWHWNRMVLIGDAAHKMSPVRGAGACTGIEDAISLVNNLKRALRKNPNPSKTELRKAFAAYQYERESPARLWLDISRLNIDLTTSPSGAQLKAMDIADSRFLPLVTDSPILDDLPFTEEKESALGWRKKPRSRKAVSEAKARL